MKQGWEKFVEEGQEQYRSLKERTFLFADATLDLIETIPQTTVGKIIASQLGRAGTSVGANYRAACRAKSPNDFIAKMKIVEEEADEVDYWLEHALKRKLTPEKQTRRLIAEAGEILAITVASIKTARKSIK